MNVSKEERFQEFLNRLRSAESVESETEALEVIDEALASVEDEMTDIPNEPANWQTDGRMYPPEADNARDVEKRPDLIRYRSRGHNTLIRDNGAIEIRDLDDRVLFSKTGKDGCGVEYEQE